MLFAIGSSPQKRRYPPYSSWKGESCIAVRRMFDIPAALVLLELLSWVLKADAAVYRTVPQSTAVLLGHDVTLNCSLSGLSEQDVVNWHWYNRASQAKHHHISAGSVVAPEFSRYSIVGDTKGGEFNLRIQNARLEDEGKYQCSVFSVDGVSRDAKLTVIVPPPEPPRITGNSKPHRVGEGAVLTCRSEGGSPLPRLSWYNGTVQHNQSDAETTGNGVEVNYPVLLLTKWHNGANLSCRADQQFPGTVQPQVVWTVLDVQYPPTVTVPRPQITVVEGGSANLSCLVDSNPVAHITWSRLGDHLPPRLEVRGQELHIPVVSRSDSGRYQCEADSSVGQGARGLITLNVLYPSSISRTFDSEISVLYGQDVLRLECVADGNPTPRVWWRRNDTNSLYENPLTLSPMDYRAEGLYECVADNDAFSEARRRTKIDVIGRPDVLSESAVISVSEGEQVILTCNISADPVSEVTWILRRPDGGEARYKVGETGHVRVTAHAGSVMCSELRIDSTYASDAGDYMCKATNIFGSDQQEFRVSVKASRTMVIAISTAAAASGTLLLIMIIFCFRWWLRRRKTSATAAKTSEAFIRCAASETKKPVNNYCESPRLKASMVEVHQLNGALKQRTCSTLVDDDSPCDELFFPFPTEVRKEYVTLDRRLCGEDESLTWDSTYYIRELQKLPTNTKTVQCSRHTIQKPQHSTITEKPHGTMSRRRSNHGHDTGGQLDRSGSRQHVDTPTIKDHHRARPDFVPRTESQRKLRTYRAEVRPPHSATAYSENLKNHHVDRGGIPVDKSPGTYSSERSQTRDFNDVDYRAVRPQPEPNRPRSSRPRRPDVQRPGHGRVYRDHYIREEEYGERQDRQTQRKKHLVATLDPVGQ
ncbi:kin of IRRE-like protein 2 isoform X1 [Branchiostoma lanceolatum]|uniref:kin of IRRE-like protein 2 isoform X1 n=1 Tax=Branchiostoma lanceolatum TaxID=7740 RepID=UPI003457272B